MSRLSWGWAQLLAPMVGTWKLSLPSKLHLLQLEELAMIQRRLKQLPISHSLSEGWENWEKASSGPLKLTRDLRRLPRAHSSELGVPPTVALLTLISGIQHKLVKVSRSFRRKWCMWKLHGLRSQDDSWRQKSCG